MKSGLIFMIMILIQYIYTSYFKNWSNVMTLYKIKLILFFSESNHSWKYRLFNIQEKLDKQPWNNLFSQKSGILSKRPIHKSWPFIRHKRPTFQFLHSSLINRTPRERKRRWKWQNWTKMWAGRGTRDIIVDAEGWSCEKYMVCAEEIGRGMTSDTQDTRKLLRIRGVVMPFLWNGSRKRPSIYRSHRPTEPWARILLCLIELKVAWLLRHLFCMKWEKRWVERILQLDFGAWWNWRVIIGRFCIRFFFF